MIRTISTSFIICKDNLNWLHYQVFNRKYGADLPISRDDQSHVRVALSSMDTMQGLNGQAKKNLLKESVIDVSQYVHSNYFKDDEGFLAKEHGDFFFWFFQGLDYIKQHDGKVGFRNKTFQTLKEKYLSMAKEFLSSLSKEIGEDKLIPVLKKLLNKGLNSLLSKDMEYIRRGLNLRFFTRVFREEGYIEELVEIALGSKPASGEKRELTKKTNSQTP